MKSLLERIGFVPRVAVWELTLRCNLSCRHCGSRAGKARPDELSLEEARRVCHELAALQCEFLTLSGGEPILRPDWAEIAETAVSLGITTGMICNGRTFTAETAETARRVGLDSVAFSLDGFAESHDYQRRLPGHFERVLAAIECALSSGLRVSAVTTVNSRNLGELARLRTLLRERGVTRWQVQLASRTGNMADQTGLMLEPRDMLVAVPLIASMCQDGELPEVFPGHDVGYYGEPEARLRDVGYAIPFWTGCSAGTSVIGIESNGNVKGCLSLPSELNSESAFVEGNLRESSLAEIWNRKGAFAYNREFQTSTLGGFCRTCEYAEICRGGCTWTCYAEKGFVRDNPYCYFRQLSEASAERPRVHLPIAPARAAEAEPTAVSAPAAAPAAERALDAGELTRAAEQLTRTGDWEGARALLEQALGLEPELLSALDLLGFVLYQSGLPEQAQGYCQRALTLAPEHAYAHQGLGLCLARQGRVEEALSELECAVSLEPQRFDAHWDLFVTLAEWGRWADADAVLARARLVLTPAARAELETELARLTNELAAAPAAGLDRAAAARAQREPEAQG